jgi:MFS family permease
LLRKPAAAKLDGAMSVPSTEPGPEAGSLLRQPAYLRFWAARFLGVLAVQAQAVTIAWQVYGLARLHHDVREAAFAVGIVGLAQFLPLFALSLTAGETADRHDRRLIAVVCMGFEVVTSGALAVLAFTGIRTLWPIYVVAVGFGASRAFISPAYTALGPMLVPRSLLPRSIAWNSLAGQGATVAGPALGGLLCAISPTVSYVVSLTLYLAAAAALASIRAETRPLVQPGSRWALVKEGLVYVWTNRIVFGAISLDLFAVLLGGATALLPVFARDVLHVGASGFGVLRAGPALGAALVALLLTARPIRRKAGLVMFAGVAAFGAATVVFALSRNLVLSVLAMAAIGAADMLSVFVRQTLVQVTTPDVMRGRVAAVSMVFIGASNELGEFESGVVARLLGPVGAALFGGVGALVVTGLWAKLFPTLRDADRLT